MRNQKPKRRLRKRPDSDLMRGCQQALGHCLTYLETLCDRSLVSKHRLHQLTNRRKLHDPPSPRHDRLSRLHTPSQRYRRRRSKPRSGVLRFYPGGVFILSLLVFLNNPGLGAYSWKLTPPFLDPRHHPTTQLSPPATPDATLKRLRAAIVQQESDENHKLLNPSGSGALGMGQVMPEDLPHWSQEALGREVSPQEFLDNPDLQVVIIDYKLNQYWQQASLQAHGNEAETVKRVAAWWYAGNPNLFTNTTPQFWNGDEYPSIAEYCRQVLERYQAQG